MTDGQKRRAPLFWLNWPVNDINHGRLMMGKGVQLKPDVNPEDLAGAVTNPMQESEVSKPAIFAVADYSWNIAGFNMDKSWADSFAYIDENASEELHTLAKHMSNPEPNGHGLVLPESEEIQGLINTYKTQLAAGNVEEATTTQLVAEMTTIIEACDGFHAKSKNEAMKAEILPFTNSLKDLCTAIRSFAQAQDAMQKNDMQSAFDLYMAGSGSYATSQTYTKEMYNASPAVVTPGSTHLIPLAKTLEAALSDPMNDYVAGDVERPLKITAEASFQTWQSGKPADIIDGNSGTYAWYNGAEGVGQYYQVNFSKPTTIYGVHIENGAGKEKPDDTFGYAKLKYQAEGSDEWKELENGKEYGPYAAKVDVAGLEIENVHVKDLVKEGQPFFEMTNPFITFLPTYLEGGNGVDNGDVEILTTDVADFIAYGDNASKCLGVVGSGNRNFNNQYCLTAKQYSQRFGFPMLADFEMRGMLGDIKKVAAIVEELYHL